MPFCPQCGVDNPAAARFCDQCGAQLIAVPAQAAPPPLPVAPAAQAPAGATISAGPSVCPQCGTAVIPGEAFCDTCGASLLVGSVAAPAGAGAASQPYGGVAPQPSYPSPQPVGIPPVAPPVSSPPPVAPPVNVTPPVAPQGRPSLAGISLAIAAGAVLALPASGEAVIGRADPVSNVFPDIDLGPHGALEHGVGRRHARIFLQGGQVLVEDLDSTNGSFLNAARLAPRQPQPLRAGDELRLGNLAFKVQL
jgi:hypothetical protein